MRKRGVWLLLLVFAVSCCLPIVGLAKKGGGAGVKVKARVGGQILIEIQSGDEISFEVDPVMNPEDTALTEILVRTNAAKYSIVAKFGEFLIGDYDLIKNEKFFIRSKAPGSGQGIDDWIVPKDEVVVLKGEDGRTPGEVTVVECCGPKKLDKF